MNRPSRWLSFWLLLLVVLAPLPLHAEDNAKFIEGTWRFDGQLPGDGKRPGMSWFSEWTFAGGTFRQLGYPPLHQEGKYRVAEDRDDRLKLELHDQTGTFGSTDRPLEIIVDREKKTLTIQGREGFKRLEPKSPRK